MSVGACAACERVTELRWCADDKLRRRECRVAWLDKQGVGKPVRQPPPSVGRQGSFLE